jgi:hypothetical protein
MASLFPAVIFLALLSPLLAKELGESKGKDIPLFSSPRGIVSITLTIRSFMLIFHLGMMIKKILLVKSNINNHVRNYKRNVSHGKLVVRKV